jgi:hypothetical protein
MIRPLRSELRRYAGRQPAAAFAAVVGLGTAQALLGIRSAHLYPDLAPDMYALASPAGSLAGAAQHMATVGGVCAAIVVAYYGWIVDYQHGMMPTMLLFEHRRWVLLIRKATAAMLVLTAVFVVTWVALWLAVNVSLSLNDPAIVSPSAVAWPYVLALLGKSFIISLGYISAAVLFACLTRRLVPTAVVMCTAWLATLPLTPIQDLRAYLPHVWIATWMELPDSLQFVTFFWPSTQSVAGAAALQTLVLFLVLATAATIVYLASPAIPAED